MPEVSSTPAPESTASIVEAAVADLPDSSAESGGYGELPELSAEGSNAPTSSAAATEPDRAGVPAVPVTPEERDELAELLGITETGRAKWTARIAYSKLHKAITERDRKVRETHEAALRQHETRLREVEAVERMIAEQPEAFVQSLIAANPAYGQYFKGAGTAPRQQEPSRDVSIDMPAPDMQLPDGSRTYSVQGLQRLLDWNTQQAERRISQRLQPFEQERQQRELVEAAIPRVKQQIADAEAWPLFKESKGEILAVLEADPRADLRAAYQRVVLPKLAANRDTIRQDVLRELAARPHSTVAGSSVAGSRTDDAGPQDTAEIVRQSLRGVK